MKRLSGTTLLKFCSEATPFNRRQILAGAAVLAAGSIVPGPCWLAAATGRIPQPKPMGPMTAASVAVSTASAGTICDEFLGFSYEKNSLCEPLFTGKNANLIALFKRLGKGVLRIGGNMVERQVWKADGAGQTIGQIAPSDVDALAAFLAETGWPCLYCVNLEGSAKGETTPALAAAEVAYVAKKLGPALLGVEIGNEPDLYGHHAATYQGKWSLEIFIKLWEEYRAAILAAAPGVAITGPCSAVNANTWTIPFAKQVTKKEITLLTQHYYRANGQAPTSTPEFLITPDNNLVKELADLQAASKELGIPYRIAECNSFYHGGANGVSNSYASSLWVIDYLFNCAQAEASGVNFHGGGNGGGYTAIADQAGTVVEARPEYYGILLFALAGAGKLQKTELSAGGLNATAYAVKTARGGLNLVVVNKDLTQNLELTATLPQTAKHATVLEMNQLSVGAAGPDLKAHAGVNLQGALVGPDGSFTPAPGYSLAVHGNQLKCYVPALSAALIQIA